MDRVTSASNMVIAMIEKGLIPPKAPTGSKATSQIAAEDVAQAYKIVFEAVSNPKT